MPIESSAMVEPLEWYERTAQILREEAFEAARAGKPGLCDHLISRAAALESDAASLRVQVWTAAANTTALSATVMAGA